uniref:Uncharacterized protein n=1 Tax=Triticum urartu TaxID=4572 RepID=A0A8R7PTM9_TRIUA
MFAVRPVARSRSHRSFSKASQPVLFFLVEAAKRYGAITLGHCPFNHLSCQNLARAPSPSEISVAIAKSSSSFELHGKGPHTHGLVGSCQANHIQRRRSATPNLAKSITPKPPKTLGRHSKFHATRQ